MVGQSKVPRRSPNRPLHQVLSRSRNLRRALPRERSIFLEICPPEIWNRLGTKVLPKLRSGSDLKIGIAFSVTVEGQLTRSFEADLRQTVEDLGLTERIEIK